MAVEVSTSGGFFWVSCVGSMVVVVVAINPPLGGAVSFFHFTYRRTPAQARFAAHP
jgi:hypothetical protein